MIIRVLFYQSWDRTITCQPFFGFWFCGGLRRRIQNCDLLYILKYKSKFSQSEPNFNTHKIIWYFTILLYLNLSPNVCINMQYKESNSVVPESMEWSLIKQKVNKHVDSFKELWSLLWLSLFAVYLKVMTQNTLQLIITSKGTSDNCYYVVKLSM